VAARPLLLLPKPKSNSRAKGSPAKFDPNAGIASPTVGRQQTRLGPKFDRLRLLLRQSSAQAEMGLRIDPNGIAPERALVFEVAGSLPDFYRQVQRIAGLEFLLEEEFSFEADDDFYLVRKQKEEEIRLADAVVGRLYMAMPDLRALGEILSLWDRYCHGEKFERGLTVWSKLFKLLRDIRPWGPQDRVLPETLEFWRDRLKNDHDIPVRFELELWFHEQEQRRRDAIAKVSRHVEEFGGNVIDSKSIADIRYHGMLIDLSLARVQELLADPTVTLARIDDIMYLRPQSLASFTLDIAEEDSLKSDVEEVNVDLAENEPIAAMLDGVPLENHVRLRGRLIVDDPDDFAARAPVNTRGHGTGIASLILHGDLQAAEQALKRKLVVCPVMIYDVKNGESTPPNRLTLDVIYQAVRHLLEDNAQAVASAPSVVVINLSLGDGNRPYSGRISPWARLIDWQSRCCFPRFVSPR